MLNKNSIAISGISQGYFLPFFQRKLEFLYFPGQVSYNFCVIIPITG